MFQENIYFKKYLLCWSMSWQTFPVKRWGVIILKRLCRRVRQQAASPGGAPVRGCARGPAWPHPRAAWPAEPGGGWEGPVARSLPTPFWRNLLKTGQVGAL